MAHEFSVGDKVECIIAGDDYLTKGKTYTVGSVMLAGGVEVWNDKCAYVRYDDTRFTQVKRNTKENEMTYKFKKGDKLEVVEGTCGDYLALGSIVYAVEDADVVSIQVSDEKGGEPIGGSGWYVSRFKLAEDATTALTAIDWTKPLETTNGLAVTLMSTEGRGKLPVKCYISTSESLSSFDINGVYDGRPGMVCNNLRNVPPKPIETYVYFNVYKEDEETLSTPCTYSTRELADKGASSGRVGCIKVLLVEGQFDTEE